MSRCFALVTVVINFISRNHAFTVKRVLITYGKESQRFELLFAVKSFHSARIVSRLYGGELKHCTFGCDFTKHAQDFGTKLHVVSSNTVTNSAERTLNSRIIRNRDFAAGEAQHHVQVNAPWKK